MHTEFHAFTITAADCASALGKLTRWAETRGATETIVSVTFARDRDDTAVTAVVVHTGSDVSGIQTIPVNRGTSPALPEIVVLLRAVIRDNEHGLIPTTELAKRLGGEWGARTLGQAMRRAGIPAPAQPKRRRRGYANPVSVTDLDVVRTAIAHHFWEPR